MAFGRASGPPASHQQMQDLEALLERAGHTGFRDARGPMGFTQRQAGGKFTRDEAQACIDRLEAAEDARAGARAPAEAEPALRDVPSEALAAELRRRGWTVHEG